MAVPSLPGMLSTCLLTESTDSTPHSQPDKSSSVDDLFTLNCRWLCSILCCQLVCFMGNLCQRGGDGLAGCIAWRLQFSRPALPLTLASSTLKMFFAADTSRFQICIKCSAISRHRPQL